MNEKNTNTNYKLQPKSTMNSPDCQTFNEITDKKAIFN